DASKTDVVAKFLRNGINPLLTEFQCSAVIVHHTPKGVRQGRNKTTFDAPTAYEGFGSVEWSNWARAVIVLKPIQNDREKFKLEVTKRGGRLRWRDEYGEKFYARTLAYSPNDRVIAWRETHETATVPIVEESDLATLMRLVPTSGFILKTTLITR